MEKNEKGLVQQINMPLKSQNPKLRFRYQVPIPSLFLTHNEQFQKIFFISPKFLQYLMIFSSSAAHLILYFEKSSNTEKHFLYLNEEKTSNYYYYLNMATFLTKNVHSAVDSISGLISHPFLLAAEEECSVADPSMLAQKRSSKIELVLVSNKRICMTCYYNYDTNIWA